MKPYKNIPMYLVFLLLTGSFPVIAQSNSSRKPALIRDTEIAEGKNISDSAKTKEPNPKLAEINIDIGNFYFKQKNYPAAIQRFLEAIEYQPDLAAAYEALARAYEKSGEKAKAIDTYKGFIDKYPDSSQCDAFRNKIAKLQKK